MRDRPNQLGRLFEPDEFTGLGSVENVLAQHSGIGTDELVRPRDALSVTAERRVELACYVAGRDLTRDDRDRFVARQGTARSACA